MLHAFLGLGWDCNFNRNRFHFAFKIGYEIDDSFLFEVIKIKILDHAHLAYTGAEISLLIKFGATRTIIRMDLGFGDRVEPIAI